MNPTQRASLDAHGPFLGQMSALSLSARCAAACGHRRERSRQSRGDGQVVPPTSAPGLGRRTHTRAARRAARRARDRGRLSACGVCTGLASSTASRSPSRTKFTWRASTRRNGAPLRRSNQPTSPRSPRPASARRAPPQWPLSHRRPPACMRWRLSARARAQPTAASAAAARICRVGQLRGADQTGL